MSQPTREEVQAFIDALRYGMKVSHAPAFLIAMAEGWLKQDALEKEIMRPTKQRNLSVEPLYCIGGCAFLAVGDPEKDGYWKCEKCGKEQDDIY